MNLGRGKKLRPFARGMDVAYVFDGRRSTSQCSRGNWPWTCAVQLPSVEPADAQEERLQGVLTELRLLHPWYDEGLKARGRTGFGVSGKAVADVEAMARDIVAASHGVKVAQDGYHHEMPAALKYAADDLKTFYYEAAAAQPGRAPSVDELNDWFFGETRLGSDLMYRLADNLGGLVRVIIPAAYRRPDPA